MVKFWSQKLENAGWVFTQRLYHCTIFAVSDIFCVVSTLVQLNLASAEVIWFCCVLRVTVGNLGQRSFKEHAIASLEHVETNVCCRCQLFFSPLCITIL